MRAFILGIVLALVAVSSGWADMVQDRRNCTRAPSPQARIAACTRLLKTWRTTKAIMAAIYYNRGHTYSALKQYRQAISDYGQAIRLNPQYAAAYTNRGGAYANLRMHRLAISDYDQAIRLNPRDAKAYYNRGNSHRRLKQYRRGIQDYDQAIRINPRYAAAYFNRGLLYQYILKNRRQAIADYRAAHKLLPGNRQIAAKLRSLGVEP